MTEPADANKVSSRDCPTPQISHTGNRVGMRKHARNLAFNWAAQAAGMVVLFFLSPFVVHTLGKKEFGIWCLLIELTGYLGVFDLGMRASTGRYIVYYVGRGEADKVNQTLRTGLGFFSLLSVVLLAVAVMLGWGFPVFFKNVPPSYQQIAMYLLPLLALNVWLSAMSGAFASVLSSQDRFDLMQSVDISVTVLRSAATVVALLAGWGLAGMTAAIVGGSLLSLVGNIILAHRAYPALRIWPVRISRQSLNELMNFGIAAFLGSIAIKVISRTDLILVGIFFDMDTVALYSVGATLVWYTWPFIEQIAGTVYPSLQRAAAVHDMSSVRWTYIRLIRIAMLVALLLYLGFSFFGDSFIRLWMGEDFVKASTVMIILSAGKLLNVPAMGANTLLTGTGNIWFLTVALSIEAVVNLALSIFFVKILHWGYAGVAASTLVSTFFVRSIFLPPFACRRAGMRVRYFLLRAILPGLLVAGAFSAWCLLIRRLIIPSNWPLFVLQIVVATAGYGIVVLFLLVSREDRQRFRRWLRI